MIRIGMGILAVFVGLMFASPCYETCTDYGRRSGRQTLKEVKNMWMLKFYKAYAKDKRLKRMLAYLGKFNKTEL